MMPSYVAPERRTKVISIRIPIWLHAKIVAAAAAERKSLNAFGAEKLVRGMAAVD
jgi:predicted HicB family RNase H-like nuclease